ncbi:hypothetical protein [Kinneretia aquatilis]|nr:hypothetical protein [Paucibacter aquatile]
MNALTPPHNRSLLPMRHPRHLVLALIAALIGSNAWWAYQAIDAGITRSYAEISAAETRQALAQTRALVRTMAKGSYTRQALIEAARQPVPESEPFEKEGFVWIGQLGLKFDAAGTFLRLNEEADERLP